MTSLAAAATELQIGYTARLSRVFTEGEIDADTVGISAC